MLEFEGSASIRAKLPRQLYKRNRGSVNVVGDPCRLPFGRINASAPRFPTGENLMPLIKRGVGYFEPIIRSLRLKRRLGEINAMPFREKNIQFTKANWFGWRERRNRRLVKISNGANHRHRKERNKNTSRLGKYISPARSSCLEQPK